MMRNFLEISVPDIPNDIQFQFPNSNHDPFRRCFAMEGTKLLFIMRFMVKSQPFSCFLIF